MPKVNRGGSKTGGGGRTQNNISGVAAEVRGQKLDDYIKKQIGVDINQYRDDFTRQYEGDDFVVLYEVPQPIIQRIKTLARKYGAIDFVVENVGAWGTGIITGKSLDSYIKKMNRLWGEGKW